MSNLKTKLSEFYRNKEVVPGSSPAMVVLNKLFRQYFQKAPSNKFRFVLLRFSLVSDHIHKIKSRKIHSSRGRKDGLVILLSSSCEPKVDQ